MSEDQSKTSIKAKVELRNIIVYSRTLFPAFAGRQATFKTKFTLKLTVEPNSLINLQLVSFYRSRFLFSVRKYKPLL